MPDYTPTYTTAAPDRNINQGRLTEQQKKQNHIVSEQKRREAIRRGFDRLAEIVPGMEGQGRSEAVVLQAAVEYLREQLAKKEQIKKIARSRGYSDQQFQKAYQGAEKALEEASDGEDNGQAGGGAGGSRQ